MLGIIPAQLFQGLKEGLCGMHFTPPPGGGVQGCTPHLSTPVLRWGVHHLGEALLYDDLLPRSSQCETLRPLSFKTHGGLGPTLRDSHLNGGGTHQLRVKLPR